jgi:hypothetical protein
VRAGLRFLAQHPHVADAGAEIDVNEVGGIPARADLGFRSCG